MKPVTSVICIYVLIVGFLLCAGCASYTTPEINIVPTITQVNASPDTLTLTYDVILDITNTGSNNAYDVAVMVLVSTPTDLPEYRFIHENIEVGTIEKKQSTSVKTQLALQMTPDNYSLLSRGERKAEVEAKITSMSSNIMG